jgi:hypothetical protein
VGRQAGGVGREQVVHEERVDETARLGVLEGLATDRRVAHTLYMAGRAGKVAGLLEARPAVGACWVAGPVAVPGQPRRRSGVGSSGVCA